MLPWHKHYACQTILDISRSQLIFNRDPGNIQSKLKRQEKYKTPFHSRVLYGLLTYMVHSMTSNGCAAISNQRPHHYFFNSLLMPTQNKLQRRITGPLCTESISDPNKRLAFPYHGAIMSFFIGSTGMAWALMWYTWYWPYSALPLYIRFASDPTKHTLAIPSIPYYKHLCDLWHVA